MLDPEKIVLGGGLSNIAQLCEALPAQIKRPQIRPIAGFARRARAP
jgi:predicted NBD/HSP70 family sugar kinase